MTVRAVLSFQIDAAPFSGDNCCEGDAPQLGIEVTPVLDGIPFPNLGVFDAVDMLIYGAADAETDLYTCSCGVAGCAGFHEYVQLRASDDAMAWMFPEAPYRAGLDPARFPPGVPLQVTFDKAQYLKALAALEADLGKLFKDSAIPAVVIPGWSCEQSNTKTFRGMLKAARKRRLQWDADCRARTQAEGTLRDFQYAAALPNGWTLFRELSALAWERVHDLNLEGEAELAAMRDVIGPCLLADQVSTILALSAAERARMFFAESLNLPDEAWLQASYSVVTNDEAAAIARARPNPEA
jgi:hypothetical protein